MQTSPLSLSLSYFQAYVIQELSPNGEVIRTILKRYNQFHALNQRLKKTKGVNKKNLPYLPKKKVVSPILFISFFSSPSSLHAFRYASLECVSRPPCLYSRA
jgi:PX domain